MLIIFRIGISGQRPFPIGPETFIICFPPEVAYEILVRTP